MSKFELFATRAYPDPKLLIPADNKPVGSKFLYNYPLHDIRDRDQIIRSLRYRSSVTGREYSDPEEMWADNRRFFEEQKKK